MHQRRSWQLNEASCSRAATPPRADLPFQTPPAQSASAPFRGLVVNRLSPLCHQPRGTQGCLWSFHHSPNASKSHACSSLAARCPTLRDHSTSAVWLFALRCSHFCTQALVDAACWRKTTTIRLTTPYPDVRARNQFIERFGGAGCSPRLGSEPLLCARYFGSLNLHRGRGAGTRPTVRQEEIAERDNDERADHDTE
jgi:hypothetical protein